MQAVCVGRKPLPQPAFRLCFPILAAVLSWPSHSPLHEPALAVLGLHVDASQDSPRGQMLLLLYHVLGLIPAFRHDLPGLFFSHDFKKQCLPEEKYREIAIGCRGKVQDMLDALCKGVQEKDMLAAFQGLLQPEPHVRAAAVNALPSIPLIAAREPLLMPLEFLLLGTASLDAT